VRHEAAEALGAIATDEVRSWLAQLAFKCFYKILYYYSKPK
jgi:hypothetical protein